MLQYITHIYVSKNFSNVLLSQNDTILEMSIELSQVAPNQELTILYSLSGTGTENEDYKVGQENVEELYIQPGESSATITVSALNDEGTEGQESITLTLKSVGEGYLIDPTAKVALIKIGDDEKQVIDSVVKGSDIRGGLGDDTLNGTPDDDQLDGDYGNDLLDGKDGDDDLLGAQCNDTLIGGLGDDVLEGNFGDDNLDGGFGDDFIAGSSGSDRLVGGDGADILNGGVGNDYLEGNHGNDEIAGGSGDDILNGNEDNDWLVADDGNDILIGGTGDDILNGGDGADVFFLNSPEDGFDTILDFNPQEGDKIQISSKGFGVTNLNDFRFISGVLDFKGKNIALIQNQGDTYSYFPNLADNIQIVDQQPTAISPPTNNNHSNSIIPSDPAKAANTNNPTLLDKILQRGYIKLGTSASSNTLKFDTEFVRALAAALFGDASKVEQVTSNFADTFQLVADRKVDLSARRVTENLTRDASLNVDFGPVYLYDHQAVLVRANSNIKNVLDLNSHTIGLLTGTTALDNLQNLLTPEGVKFVPRFFTSTDELFTAYSRGEIDAVSTDRSLIYNRVGSLSQAQNQRVLDVEFSQEPIALVLPENESEWADVVRWVTNATIQAEEFGISSQNIDQIFADNTDKRDDNDSDLAIRRFLGLEDELGAALGIRKDFVVQVIKQVGNYGEIYQRSFPNLERDRNLLWTDGGLMYSLPFSGSSDDVQLIDNDQRQLLAEIQQRGVIKFGLPETLQFPGIAAKQNDGTLKGFDVDLARALSAAVFGDASKVEFVTQSLNDAFVNAANGIVDVSAGAYTHNLIRDAKLGIDYSPTYLYSQQGILTRFDSGITTLPTLNGRKIGVVTGTSALQNLEDALEKFDVSFTPSYFDRSDDMYAAYVKGDVDAIFNDITLLAGKIPTFEHPEEHEILKEVFSKEPLALVIDENQSEWADVVRWVTYSLIQAEEYGITSKNIDELIAKNTNDNLADDSDAQIQEFLGIKGNLGATLGLPNDFVVKIIQAVGNYEEIYARNFNTDLLPRDQNELYSNFGIQYAPPFSVNNASLTDEPDFPLLLSRSLANDKVLKLGSATKLKLKINKNNSTQVNEIGVFVVDDDAGTIGGLTPGASGYAQAALARAQIMFSAIANLPQGFAAEELSRILDELPAYTRLGFYAVQNGTTDALLRGQNQSVFFGTVVGSDNALKLLDAGNNTFSLVWRTPDGSNFLDLEMTIQPTTQLPTLGTKTQTRSQGEMLDLREMSNQSTTANFMIYREAAFDNFVGFYRVIDPLNGAIDTGNGIVLPGEAGYTQAAIKDAQKLGINLSTANQNTTTLSATLDKSIFAPFIVSNSSFEQVLNGQELDQVYFSFLSANRDGVDHIRMLGDNIFSFEDLPGGGDVDYNDIIMRVNL
ncbi:MAG: transporter substrate-binding domain-containing protein [Nostoc sp. CmiVER01]|uniref:transporter substrate-binding domain-containing protein n=1 Tax=Nostoc sp. CmiVER01 TaxID=3075384 RepID=UPI003D160C44